MDKNDLERMVEIKYNPAITLTLNIDDASTLAEALGYTEDAPNVPEDTIRFANQVQHVICEKLDHVKIQTGIGY